ncbi:MAG: GMC family oxidoreductase N-terminal domain-containing protein [Ilumatobacteraceae bacterium]
MGIGARLRRLGLARAPPTSGRLGARGCIEHPSAIGRGEPGARTRTAVGGRRCVAPRDVDGRRVSVNDAYLEPARDRPNLDVVGDTVVDRVLLRGVRATGVRFASGDEIRADTVILAAGAIHSPAVLLRSGIASPGIGANLHDHPSFPITLRRQAAADPARCRSPPWPRCRRASDPVASTTCSCCRSTISARRRPTWGC